MATYRQVASGDNVSFYIPVEIPAPNPIEVVVEAVKEWMRARRVGIRFIMVTESGELIGAKEVDVGMADFLSQVEDLLAFLTGCFADIAPLQMSVDQDGLGIEAACLSLGLARGGNKNVRIYSIAELKALISGTTPDFYIKSVTMVYAGGESEPGITIDFNPAPAPEDLAVLANAMSETLEPPCYSIEYGDQITVFARETTVLSPLSQWWIQKGWPSWRRRWSG